MRLAYYVFVPFLFLSQLVLTSAQESKQNTKCPVFQCGRFGKVGFPFSNTTNLECGLCVLDGTGTQIKVKCPEGEEWWDVYHLNYSTRTIEASYHSLPNQVREGKHCDSNISFPLSPFLSISDPEIHRFIKCNREPDPIIPFNFFHEFQNYTGCKDYDLYFYDDPQKCLPRLPETLSKRCLVVYLPSTTPQSLQLCLANGLTSAGDGIFSINWQVLPDCLKCHNKGGQCQSIHNGNCVGGNWNKGGNNIGRKVGIGVGAGIGSVLVTCILFSLYQRRKRNKLSSSSALISRSFSVDPSLKQDLEQGSIYFQTPKFTYKELDEATNHFDTNKELGDGGFGTVYHGKLRDGRVVAVKRLFEHNYKRVEQFMNEIVILSRLRHQNLVSLYGCTNRHSRELLLVYEYVPNGTVADHLHGNRAENGLLTWPIRMSIAIESADALAYLHASDVVHRDVKTNNILLDKDFHVKVADFGVSRLFPLDVTHVSTAPQGTPGYVDPEYYQCYQLNEKSDVYSFGVVLIELISSKPAVDIGRHRHEINLANMAINRIHNRELHDLVDPTLGFDSDYSTRNMITLVAELAFRCLQQEKEMRPFMAEVLETLKGIENEEYKKKKADELDIPADECPLKNSQLARFSYR